MHARPLCWCCPCSRALSTRVSGLWPVHVLSCRDAHSETPLTLIRYLFHQPECGALLGRNLGRVGHGHRKQGGKGREESWNFLFEKRVVSRRHTKENVSGHLHTLPTKLHFPSTDQVVLACYSFRGQNGSSPGQNKMAEE